MKKAFTVFSAIAFIFLSVNKVSSQLCVPPPAVAPVGQYISVDAPVLSWTPNGLDFNCYAYGVGIFNFDIVPACYYLQNLLYFLSFGSDTVWIMDNSRWATFSPTITYGWGTRKFGGSIVYGCASSLKRLTPALPYTSILSPGNGWSGTDTTILFDWAAVSGASSYRVTFFDTRSMQNIFFDTNTIYDSIRVLSGKLPDYKTYWWKVKPYGNGGEGPYSDPASFTYLYPSPVSLVWPLNTSTISTTIPGLDWTDVNGVTAYEVQVARDPLFSNIRYQASGLINSSAQIPPGYLSSDSTYYWRVRDNNSYGNSYWSPVWRFSISTNIWVPLNSVTTEPLLSGFFVDSLTGWIGGGTFYPTYTNVTIKTTNGGINWITLSNPFGYDMPTYSIYFLNSNTGWAGGSTGYFRKTTDGGMNWQYVPPPGYFSIFAINFFDENTGLCGIGYTGQQSASIAKTTNGGNNWITEIGDVTNELRCFSFPSVNTGYICGGAPGTGVVYRTSNNGDNWSLLPGTRTNLLYGISFKDINTGWAVGENGTILYTNSGGSSWVTQTSGTGAHLRAVHFYPNSITGCIVGDAGTILYTSNEGINWIPQSSQTTNNLYTLAFSGRNLWAAGASGTILKNSNQGAGLPSAPVLTSPANGSVSMPLTPLLDWSDIPGAVKYRVQISTDPYFNTLTLDDSTSVASQFSVPPGALQNYVVYYWNVSAKNAVGWSSNSIAWNFRTFGLPQSVVLNSPANNSTELPTSITFKWYNALQTFSKPGKFYSANGTGSVVFNSADGPEAVSNYWFELTDDTLSFLTIIKDSTISDTTKFVSGLTGAKTYYWRVKARNEVGWGAFSYYWKFTTTLGPPQPPVLAVPANNTVQLSANLGFRWYRAVEITDKLNGKQTKKQLSPDAVTGYWFELTSDTVTLAGLVRDTTLTDTLKSIGTLNNNTSYYWRVKAKNASGWSVFGSWWRFIAAYTESPWTLVNGGYRSISFVDPNNGWATDGYYVYKTTDASSSWNSLAYLGTYSPINDICFKDTSNGALANTSYPEILSTADGGNNWGSWSLSYFLWAIDLKSVTSINGTNWVCGSALYRPNVGFTAGNWPFVYRFSGGGMYQILDNVSLNKITLINPNLGWIGSTGRIYKIQGTTFTPYLISGAGNITGISFPTENTGYAVGGSSAYKSTNGGVNWNAIYPLLPAGSYSDVKFMDSLTGYISCNITPNNAGILATTNGGANWAIQYFGPIGTAQYEISFPNPSYGWVSFGNSIIKKVTGGAAPNLISPLNGSTGITLTPLLNWNDVTGATKYRVLVSTDSTFGSSFIDDSSSVTSQFSVPPGILTTFTTYYWKVATKNSLGWGAFSSSWNFRTFGSPLQVTLASPANNSIDQYIDLSFSWYRPGETMFKQNPLLSTDKNFVLNNKEESSVISSSKTDRSGLTGTKHGADAINTYWFELVTDTVSHAGLIQDTTVTDTTKSINGLGYSTVYYWHVKAHNETGWGQFSGWWKFTTTNGLPGIPVQIYPPDRAADIPVTPLFDWSDVAGAVKYRIQVSPSYNFTTLTIDDSSSVTSQFQTPPGYIAYNSGYYWRVKARSVIGWGNYQTSPFVFYTLIAPPPAPPVLTSPANGATGVSLTPLLDWNDALSEIISESKFNTVKNNSAKYTASNYRVQLSADSLFASSIIDDSSLTISQFQVLTGTLNSNTDYYWRVKGKNNFGWGNYSSIWHFRTIGLPSSVILYKPAKDTINQPTDITFIWYKPALSIVMPLTGNNTDRSSLMNISSTQKKNPEIEKNNTYTVSAYWFELVTDTITLAGLIRDTSVTDTTKQVNGLNTAATYYWRVKAMNQLGWGGFSAWWKFTTTGGVPPAPVLISPYYRQPEVQVTPLFEWSDVSGALKYRIQVSPFNNFSTLTIDDSSSTASQFQTPAGYIAYNSGYFWRVKAKNNFGWGSYQSPFVFYTQVIPPPPVPVLISPPNGSTGLSLTPALDWNDASGAVKYRMQISTDSLFSTTVIDDSTMAASQYIVQPGVLNYFVKYYWRVAAKNLYSWSSFSGKWNFKTLGLPYGVNLFSPANNATEIPVSTTFIWYKASEMILRPYLKNINDKSTIINGRSGPDAVSAYWFEIATDTVTLAGLIQDSTLTDTTKALSGLAIATNYWWHVKAKNENGWGAFSPWWKFTTTLGVPPAAPVLISPFNRQADVPVTPLFDWSDAAGAVKYRIQISPFNNFSTLTIDDSSSTVSQFQTPPGYIAYNSGYFWRVKAKNSIGWGSYQVSPFVFYTKIVPPPPPPVLLSPANGSMGQSLTPLLDWTDVSGAVKYRVQLSINSNFTTNLIDDSSAVTSQYNVQAGLLSGSTFYYWRVAAKNTTWSSFSNAWNFKTFSAPSAIILYKPAKDTTEQPVSLSFSWYRPSEAMLRAYLWNGNNSLVMDVKDHDKKIENNGKYEADVISAYWFELITDTVSFGGLIRDTTLSDTVKSLSGLSMATSYYWRVKAKNEQGWGTFSLWWKFTTTLGVPPAAPVLISPSNRQAEVPVTPLFDWSDVSGAVKYRVQVSAYSNFSVLWIDDSSSTVSQFQAPPGYLAYNSGYFWRVKAMNSYGWGAYQVSPFVFYTQVTPPLAPPALISPSNGATGVSLTPTLDWSDVSGAAKYRIQVSFNSGFSTNIIDDSSSVSSQFTVSSALIHDTVYYWRVAVKNSTTWSSFTNAWSFRTVGVMVPPVLLYPANHDTGIVVTPVFDWSDVTGTTGYRLQVSAFINFSVLWIDVYTPGSGYQTPPGFLAYNSRYFWRVKSISASDSSGFSNANDFFTKLFPGTTDEITSAREKKKTLELPQMAKDKAKKFTIEICKDTLFDNLLLTIDDIQTTVVNLPTDKLENYSTYFWRAKISDNISEYNFTPVKVFVTGIVKENPENVQVQLPTKFALYQNYPNPFNPATNITFDLAGVNLNHEIPVVVRVYDLLGREMITLVNSKLKPGTYKVSFDGSNYPSGIYFYTIEAEGFTDSRKMVLLK